MYQLQGKSHPGDGRGRTLGFPTANIVVDQPEQLPASGIYAVMVTLHNQHYPAVMHVGPRPTYDDARLTVEVHILNYPDQDLYGQEFTVEVIKKLREVLKFTTEEDLIRAMTQDCQQAAAILADCP